MSRSLSISTILCLFTLNSCFIADSVFLEPEKPKNIDIEELAKNNIRNYLTEKPEGSTYQSYSFGEMIVIKPVEIEWLETLQAQLKENPHDEEIKASISKQEALIREKKIERKASMTHAFILGNENSDSLDYLVEMEYLLNDTLGVIDERPLSLVDVNNDERLIAEYFFKSFTIFRQNTYSQSRSQTNVFYQFYKQRLNQMISIERRSNFLKHILNVCLEVKASGSFNPDRVAQRVLKTYIKNERSDIAEYAPIQFSDLYETKDTEKDSVIGYYFFHKFTGNYNEAADTNVVLVEYDPYYEVSQIFLLEGTFESYTEQ